MPKFTIPFKNSHNANDSYGKLKKVLSEGNDLTKYDSGLKCTFEDDKKICTLKGSKFSAHIKVLEHTSGSELKIEVDLPLLLTPFKSKIEETVQKMLKKYLA